MSDKSPRKSNEKKKGETLQEKRAAKRMKNATKASTVVPNRN